MILCVEDDIGIEIFLQSSVNGLSEPEDVFHDSVGVFHLAAHRGFALLNRPLAKIKQ